MNYGADMNTTITMINAFNSQALVEPKSHEDVNAIFSEIRSELANLNRHLDQVAEACEREMQVA